MMATMAPVAAHAADEKPTLSYALSKARVSAAVAHRITACPPPLDVQIANGANYELAFDYTVLIEGKSVPSRLVTVDPTSGFLVDRTTKMTFNEDGLTLKEYNATATGQGGPLIVGLIKAAAAVYGLTANPLALAAVAAPVDGPPRMGQAPVRRPVEVTRYYMVCRKAVADGLERLTAVRRQVASLEAQSTSGALAHDQVELLARRRAEVTEIEAGLTITTKAESVISPTLTVAGPGGAMASLVKPADFEQWFEVRQETRKLNPDKVKSSEELRSDDPFTVKGKLASLPGMVRMPDGSEAPGPMSGIYGYEVTLALDAQTLSWFSCGPKTEKPVCGTDDPDEKSITGMRGLVYRRPVVGTVSLQPLDQPCTAAGACAAAMPDADGKPRWLGRDQASKSGGAKFPQLSRLFVLPTGGSIFGSRAVGATFDPTGTPTMLQFDKGAGVRTRPAYSTPRSRPCRA